MNANADDFDSHDTPPDRFATTVSAFDQAGRLEQLWLNLAVWLGLADSGRLAKRRVVLPAAPYRSGLGWRFELPGQCWNCATRQGLRVGEVEGAVRGFDSPLSLMMFALGIVALLLLAAGWLDSLLLLFAALAVLAVAVGVLGLRSWVEPVRMRLSACERHLQTPGLRAVLFDNDLHLFLSQPDLAVAFRAQIKAARSGRVPSHTAAPRAATPVHATDTSADIAPWQAPTVQLPRREELPTIRLADEAPPSDDAKAK